MTDGGERIFIDYYTDALCVWAWIAQPRLDELQRQWGDRLGVRHRCVDIFGDSHGKIRRQWGEHDGFERFSTHVAESVSAFDECIVDPRVWSQVRPRSSLQAHLLLKAVSLVAGDEAVGPMALRIRRAFFVEARDISDQSLLLALAAKAGLDRAALEDALLDGSALARLSEDQRSAIDLSVRGSPTWVINDGRQILYGNVGYRILHANIEELLKHPHTEASWC
jgi:predicted DsbA family dithiol-disulfide isomerase